MKVKTKNFLRNEIKNNENVLLFQFFKSLHLLSNIELTLAEAVAVFTVNLSKVKSSKVN